VEDAGFCRLGMWDQIETNKTVAYLFPNDADGQAWFNPEKGLEPILVEGGYTTGSKPEMYQPPSEDFTSQISDFKKAGCEVCTGVQTPPDFTTFIQQCAQQGYQPKIMTMSKASLFHQTVEAIGDLGIGLSDHMVWHPNFPYKSYLTGQTCKEYAEAYTEETGKQWTQPIMHYAVFEVVADAIKRTENIDDKESIIAAVEATNIETISGPVSWSGGENNPVKNVSITPLVGGQWVPGEKYMYDLKIVSNTIAPDVPTNGELKLMEY